MRKVLFLIVTGDVASKPLYFGIRQCISSVLEIPKGRSISDAVVNISSASFSSQAELGVYDGPVTVILKLSKYEMIVLLSI